MYDPFNPVVWVTFFGCLASVYLCVKLYHRKYPNYPRDAEARRTTPEAFSKRLVLWNSPLLGGDIRSEIQK